MCFLQTAGTHSCATVAIGSFKGDNYARNEEYLADKSKGEKLVKPAPEAMTVKGCGSPSDFYSKIIWPTLQDLGRTDDYPFDYLMDIIDGGSLNGKYMTTLLNTSQFEENDRYWHKRFIARGFELVDKTKNDIGSVCYIYVRNRNRRAIEADEK